MKVYLEGMVEKYLVNLNQNTTIYAYIINISIEVPDKIQWLKQSTQIGARPSFYTCVIECVVLIMLKFTLNENTISSY